MPSILRDVWSLQVVRLLLIVSRRPQTSAALDSVIEQDLIGPKQCKCNDRRESGREDKRAQIHHQERLEGQPQSTTTGDRA